MYIDMLKANIDDDALRVKSADEVEDAVKVRLDGACTRLMDGTFNTRLGTMALCRIASFRLAFTFDSSVVF